MNHTGPSRRDILRGAALAGASLVVPNSLALAAPNDGSTLTLGIPGVPPTLDPLNLLNHDWMVVTQAMYENLIEFDDNGNLQPQLAASMPTVSADGLTY